MKCKVLSAGPSALVFFWIKIKLYSIESVLDFPYLLLKYSTNPYTFVGDLITTNAQLFFFFFDRLAGEGHCTNADLNSEFHKHGPHLRP